MVNIEYALKNGCLTHVSEVERGLACGCACPGCNEKMIARKGSKMAHHFAHRNIECSKGLETTLHLMAKTILEQEKKILLPKVTVDFDYRVSETIFEQTTVEAEEVILENRFEGIVPDVLIKTGKKLLAVEIWVTHKVDDNKLSKIKDAGISVIEVDLSKLNKMVDIEGLRKILLEETEQKSWLYNRFSEYYRQKWLSLCEVKEIVQRGLASHVDYCPIPARVWKGKPYANMIDDCTGCKFFIQATRHHDPRKNDEFGNDKLLYCSGKAKIGSISDLKEYLNKRE